jgi:hypothetical protein
VRGEFNVVLKLFEYFISIFVIFDVCPNSKGVRVMVVTCGGMSNSNNIVSCQGFAMGRTRAGVLGMNHSPILLLSPHSHQ